MNNLITSLQCRLTIPYPIKTQKILQKFSLERLQDFQDVA